MQNCERTANNKTQQTYSNRRHQTGCGNAPATFMQSVSSTIICGSSEIKAAVTYWEVLQQIQL